MNRPADIPSLAGWRAIAAILVVLGHAKLIFGGFAYLAVTIFFFLSGYLITTLMISEVARTGTVGIQKFFVRRFLRLTPPFFVTLAVVYALTYAGWVSGGTQPMGLASLLFYFHNYYLFFAPDNSIPLGVGVYWSLAIEQHFYLVFPALFLVFYRQGKPRKLQWILAGLCALALVWRLVLTLGCHAEFARIYYATDTRLDSILFGCLLALWRMPPRHGLSGKEKCFGNPWFLSGLVAMGAAGLLRAPVFRQTLQFTIQGLALMPLFHFSIRSPGSLVFRALNHPWMGRIGDLSYTIYLIHCVVLFNIEKLTSNRPIGLIVSMAIIGLYAWLMEIWVEKPLKALRERWR